MPLLDHFHPPLSERRHWEAFHARWASAIADDLNERGLPDHLFAEPSVTIGGQAQVDVAALDSGTTSSGNGVKSGTLLAAAVNAPAWTIPATFVDSFEVQIFDTEGGPRLVAAIELVSPANKDRPQSRRSFAIKCASYLCQGSGCLVVDVVTSRAADLHNEIMELLQQPACRLPAEPPQYAASYRPVRRGDREEVDIWKEQFRVGETLPRLPLFLGADLPITADFETSYQETCRRLLL